MMRVLLLAPIATNGCLQAEIVAYQSSGWTVTANLFLLSASERCKAQELHSGRSDTRFVIFDPDDRNALIEVFYDENLGYDAVVVPYPYETLDEVSFSSICNASALLHRLALIGVPNDSLYHVRKIVDSAERSGVMIVSTCGIHAESVAEYTLFQFGFHARRLSYFCGVSHHLWSAAHRDAVAKTHLLAGKTLGVIGATGRDGSAVIALAQRLGMKVACSSSRTESGNIRMKLLGAHRVESVQELCGISDFLSVNCRMSAGNAALIGTKEIHSMKQGVIVVCPASAEVFDRDALRSELLRSRESRNIHTLVFDMPYGWNSEGDIQTEDFNSWLAHAGVQITPRIAGYTSESRLRASVEIANAICSRVPHEIVSSATSVSSTIDPGGLEPLRIDDLLRDLLDIVLIAGNRVEEIRESSLTIESDSSGCLSTNADIEAAHLIEFELQRRGWNCIFSGEEYQECSSDKSTGIEVVIDGIDGTRNFRDFNFGWCISVAACLQGSPILAVVHDHHCGETYYCRKGGGAFIVRRGSDRHKALSVPCQLQKDFSFSIGSFRVAGSSERKLQIAESIKALGGRGREWGSVALSICAVARGGMGVFIQASSHRHDHIAAVAIAKEAGAFVGSDFSFELPKCEVLVCHPSLAKQMIAIFDSDEIHATSHKQSPN